MFETNNLAQLLTEYGVYSGSFLINILSGFIPVINSEVFLVLISTTLSKALFLPVLLISATGQMLAKVVMYLAGRGILKISFKKYEEKMNEVLLKMQKWQSKTGLFLFISSFTGFPPFYLVTIAAGMIKMNLIQFFIFGFAGRFLRFTLLLYFPYYFKEIFW